MSDSVDRVFVHALQTVRRLPRTGSSRPPPDDRLRLYGLYKQSMEGDVLCILPRPTLPPSSPDPASSNVHRYASRDLRAREAQAETEKWDAWHACAGMSRTEAKRRYIETLIEMMKRYASGTSESRELVEELEFIWGQIRSQSGSEEEGGNGNGNGNGSPRTGCGELPRRVALDRTALRSQESYATLPPGRRASSARDEGGGTAGNDGNGSSSRLRVLSPVGSGGSDHVVESEDAESPERNPAVDDEEEAEDEFHDSRDGSEGHNNNNCTNVVLDRWRPPPSSALSQDRKWTRRIESALTRMTAEIAALREQMSESKVFPISSSTSQGRRYNPWAWMKWLAWAAVRHLFANFVLLLVFVLWERWSGNARRAEEWAKRRWKSIRDFLEGVKRWVLGGL